MFHHVVWLPVRFLGQAEQSLVQRQVAALKEHNAEKGETDPSDGKVRLIKALNVQEQMNVRDGRANKVEDKEELGAFRHGSRSLGKKEAVGTLDLVLLVLFGEKDCRYPVQDRAQITFHANQQSVKAKVGFHRHGTTNQHYGGFSDVVRELVPTKPKDKVGELVNEKRHSN